jgi:hypothetical protein
MLRLVRLALICLAGFTGVGMAAAQTAVGAPVPPALLMGKKVFLSNAGGDSGLFPHPFSGGQQRGYDTLYDAMVRWGRYEMVADPAQADLVFELQLNAPNGPSNGEKVKGAADPLPMFRLTIYDRRSHYVLWALTSSVDPANLQKTHDKNFDDALDFLIANLKALVGAPVTRNP